MANTKLKEDCIRVAIMAISTILAFTIARAIMGFWLAAPAVAAGAVIITIMRRKQLEQELLHRRQLALQSIADLLHEIRQSQNGYGDYDFDENGESFFSLARARSQAIHKELHLRARYLDGCAGAGTTPLPGADWHELAAIARRMIEHMRGTAYWCTQGFTHLKIGLIDPDWKSPYFIHYGGGNELDDDEASETRNRVVVPMSDYEFLRPAARPQREPGRIYTYPVGDVLDKS